MGVSSAAMRARLCALKPMACGEGGAVTTTLTDPGALFYLVIGLLVASLVLIFVHPGKDDGQ